MITSFATEQYSTVANEYQAAHGSAGPANGLSYGLYLGGSDQTLSRSGLGKRAVQGEPGGRYYFYSVPPAASIRRSAGSLTKIGAWNRLPHDSAVTSR